MRHRKKTDRLSRSRAPRKALVKSSVRNLLIYERIKTTNRKAKVISAKAEELINLAKRNDLHSRREAYSFLQDHKLVKKLFDEIAPRFQKINGGCVRRIGFGIRKGDGAELALLELTVLGDKLAEKKEPSKKGKPVSKKEPKPSQGDKPKDAESKKGLKKGLKKMFKKKKDKE